MQIDVGMDAVRLPHDEQADLAREAARLGFGRWWTTGGGDPFQSCAVRWTETRSVVQGGLPQATGVVAIGPHTPFGVATATAALTNLTEGRFILGIGSGSVHSAAYRRTWGIREHSSLALVRAYLTILRGLLAGEAVSYEGGGFSYYDARLAGGAAPTPLYIGALGPEMLRLAGELADGVCLSWCTPAQVEVVRAHLAEGARSAGRDPADVKIATYVRVCIDDNVDAARRALGRAMINYAIGWPGASGPQVYRTHFERMGFPDEVADLAQRRAAGASEAEVVEAFPERLLNELGYYGPAAGAAAAFRRLAGNADVAILRIVPSRPDAAAIRDVLAACPPALVPA